MRRFDPDPRLQKSVVGCQSSVVSSQQRVQSPRCVSDQAFQYLEKAYADGDSELLFVIRYPALDPLRSDPRFKDLMRHLGLPE